MSTLTRYDIQGGDDAGIFPEKYSDGVWCYANEALAQIAELTTELAAIKVQAPVAARVRFRHPQKTMPDWSVWQQTQIKPNAPAWTIDGAGYEVEYQPLYAAPVSEAKAQGVAPDLQDFEAWWRSTPILSENKRTIAEKAWLAARLNAAPVQQVSVPDEREAFEAAMRGSNQATILPVTKVMT